MIVTLTDRILPRRFILPRSKWDRMSRRQKLRLAWWCVRRRGRITPNRWVQSNRVYMLDMRYTWHQIIEAEPMWTNMEGRERAAERIHLYGELALSQEYKRGALTFDIPMDA